MNFPFEVLQVARRNFSGLLRDLSIEQLNHIPDGFNNNILWNYGHIIVTQQLLFYGLSGLPLNIDAELVRKYRKGLKPEGFIDAAEFQTLKAASIELVQQSIADYEKGVFQKFTPYPTSYRVTLNDIDAAVYFNNIHEAMHLGVVMALKKLV
jgi:hypothetical protein